MSFLHHLYDRIGLKIKILAVSSFIVEAVGAFITGLVFLLDSGFEEAWWALLIMILGPVVAFVGSWMLYGFGEIIDKLTEIERNTGLAYKPDEVKREYVQEERAKYEAEEQAKIELETQKLREAEEKARREADEKRKREEREAEEKQRQAILEIEEANRREARAAEAQLKHGADEQSQKDAMEKLAALATPIRLNRFGEARCPKCSRDLDHKGKTTPQKCSKCGFLYKIIR